MGLTADIYDIFGFTNHVISEAAALQASITDVTTAVNHFAALLDNQSGATVVSMRNNRICKQYTGNRRCRKYGVYADTDGVSGCVCSA